MEHDVYEAVKPSGYYACLNEELDIVARGSLQKGFVYFDDVVCNTGSHITLDKVNKAIGIAAGASALIAVRASMIGKAPSDGNVHVEVIDKTTGAILNDANGHPISKSRKYKTGDELGILQIATIVKAKSELEFKVLIEHTFTTGEVALYDRTQGNSCVVVQYLGKDSKTGGALIQYCIDNQVSIKFNSHHFGDEPIFTIDGLAGADTLLASVPAKTSKKRTDGLHLYNITDYKAGVVDGAFKFTSDAGESALFTFGKIFNSAKTEMLQGKSIPVDIVMQNEATDMIVQLAKWAGVPDEQPDIIISDWETGSPVTKGLWSLDTVNTQLIPASKSADFKKTSFAMTVPEDISNFAIIVRPSRPLTTVNVSIKGFYADSEKFDVYLISSVHELTDLTNKYSESTARFFMNSEGKARLYMAINTADTEIPVGQYFLNSGTAPVIAIGAISSTHTKNVGALYLQVNASGRIQISSKLRIEVSSKMPVNGSDTLTLTWRKKAKGTATFTPIPQSVESFVIDYKDSGVYIQTQSFEADVADGDILQLVGKTDKYDGVITIESNDVSQKLIDTRVLLNKISPYEALLQQKLELLDRHLVVTEPAEDEDCYIELDYDKDDKPVITAKQRGIK